MEHLSSPRPVARSCKAAFLVGAGWALTAATLPYENVLLDTPYQGAPQEFRPGSITLPQSEVAALGEPVEDAVLREMRGKFISPEAVSFFGISMLTSWQDEKGITTTARLALNIDFLGGNGVGAAPQLLVGWVRDGDSAMDVSGIPQGYVALNVSPDEVMPVGALDTISGAAQANVIAGADNSARNSMQIAVVPMSSVPSLTAQDGLQPATETTNVGFDDGDQLQFRLADNQVGIVLTGNNGLDSTIQTVGGDLGQALQQTMLQSDRNHVFNTSTIIFGVDAASNLDRVQTDEAMLSMKGFAF